MTSVTPQFDHQLVRLQGRLLLDSICVHCGNSKIVSAADGSLTDWEAGHLCTNARKPAEKIPLPAASAGAQRSGNL
ncbi:MAG TPA: hypothetical protein VFE06_18555 [Acidobacteriaceae bacterium]|nr:hypothetical protein [Acidobacteriaceae bacterium]